MKLDGCVIASPCISSPNPTSHACDEQVEKQKTFMSMKPTILAVFLAIAPCLLRAQTVTSFEGIDAAQVAAPGYDVDANEIGRAHV